MSESATKRLKKVAIELNVATTTIVEFLEKKGIEVDNNPNAKISQDHYEILLEKFQPDKLEREKSKKIVLPNRSKQQDEPAEVEEVLVKSNVISEEKKVEKPSEPKPPIEKPKEEKPIAEEVKKETREEEKKGGLKVLGKIDLESQKKGKKKPKPSKPSEEKAEAPKVKQEEADKPELKPEQEKTPVPEEKSPEPVAEKEPEVKEEKPIEKEPIAEEVKPEPPAKEIAEEKPVEAKAEEKPSDKPEEKSITETTPSVEQKKPVEEQKKVEEKPEEPKPPVTAEESPKDKPSPESENEKEVDKETSQAERSSTIPEKPGLTILGKIDLDQFKKKKPVASTSDPSSIKKKRRKRKKIGPDGKPTEGGETTGRTDTRGGRQGEAKPLAPGQRPPHKAGDRKPVAAGRPPGRGDRRGPMRDDKQPVDDKQIQEQIKATMSRLSGQNQKGQAKTKLKKKKREQRETREQEQVQEETNILSVTEFITVNEFANLMNVSVTEVIMTCMNMGLMVSINQRLDAETITFVADEFGFDVAFKEVELDEPSLEQEDSPKTTKDRAPIVTIMGHVDHGKTSLLDFVRNANVVAGEAGGITQHIGAYEVTLDDGRKITFLDTPGHEAFTAMRARGAKVTDIAIIVIAADDTVMPQTREAISHAQAAGVPIVFAFNKIDKEGANINRIKEQLAELNILVEDWGGKYQSQEISAKQGLYISELLDKVLLEAEMLELTADPAKRAVGTVVEASLDKGKGIVATVLVQAGTLKIGDPVLAGANYGKVKAMYNERGGRITSAGPSTPVQLLGFDAAPQAGDKFYVTENDSIAKEIASQRRQLLREQGMRTKKHITLDEIGRRLAIGTFKELNIIIKGDVDGSVEALSDSLQKLSTEEVQVNVIHKAVGQISESDVLLASASDAVIIGFQVRPSLSARKLAETEQIDIRLYSVIYNAIEEIKAAMEGLLAPTVEEKVVCTIEVRDVFKITKVGTVAGCMVIDGKVTRNTKVRLLRQGIVVYTGEIDALKRFKEDVKEVAAGYECGISLKNYQDINEGDVIEGFEEIEIKRKL